MKRFPLSTHMRVLATLLALVLMTAQVACGTPSQSGISTPLPSRTWTLVNSPNGSLPDSVLYSVAVVSAKDVWAAGVSNCRNDTCSQTLIEHWNGARWSVVTSPNVEVLGAVTVVSANDIWAVGSSKLESGDEQTLIEHWNGTSWSVVTSPNDSSNDFFNSVAAGSANDIWAVGGEEGTNTLIAHCC
jgi:hypothetical protein